MPPCLRSSSENWAKGFGVPPLGGDWTKPTGPPTPEEGTPNGSRQRVAPIFIERRATADHDHSVVRFSNAGRSLGALVRIFETPMRR